jgi:hypothetical protein
MVELYAPSGTKHTMRGVSGQHTHTMRGARGQHRHTTQGKSGQHKRHTDTSTTSNHVERTFQSACNPLVWETTRTMLFFSRANVCASHDETQFPVAQRRVERKDGG